MENDQLVIKGKRYDVADMDTLPKSLKPVHVTSKTNATVFSFFGELNPLSNFYPAEFTIEGKVKPFTVANNIFSGKRWNCSRTPTP